MTDPDSQYGTGFENFQITVLKFLRNKLNTVSNFKIYTHKINFFFINENQCGIYFSFTIKKIDTVRFSNTVQMHYNNDKFLPVDGR